jgi:hypothetical protein
MICGGKEKKIQLWFLILCLIFLAILKEVQWQNKSFLCCQINQFNQIRVIIYTTIDFLAWSLAKPYALLQVNIYKYIYIYIYKENEILKI